MEGEFIIDNNARLVLEKFHRTCIDKKTADRIKAILLIADGYTYSQIERILMLDERTLNRYKRLYIEEGIDGLVANNYQGRHGKLDKEEIDLLKKELGRELYQTAEKICNYVKKTFKVEYSVKGMVQLLHRMGFNYKKTSIIPGKTDVGRQKKFIRNYKRRYQKPCKDEKVYFLDGSHPTYNNYAGYGWIERGKQFGIKSNDGRERLNLLGAYEPKNIEVVVRDYDTLNQEAVIDFLRILKRRNTGKKIHIICDNARYQHAKAVREAAKEMGIKLKYLPGYSPNLNLIERYWGYLKRKVLVNKYYETYEKFKEAILKFSRSKSKKHKIALQKYIPEKFHLLEPVFA